MIFIPKFAGQHGLGWDMGSSTFCVTRPWWPSRLMARFMQKFVFGIWWWSRNHGQLYNVRHFPQGVPHPAKIRGVMAGYELTMVMFDTFVEQPEIVQSFATNIHSDPRPNSPGSLFTKKNSWFRTPNNFDQFCRVTLKNILFPALQRWVTRISKKVLHGSFAPRSTKQLQKSLLCCRWHVFFGRCFFGIHDFLSYQHQPPGFVGFMSVDHSKNILRNPLFFREFFVQKIWSGFGASTTCAKKKDTSPSVDGSEIPFPTTWYI